MYRLLTPILAAVLGASLPATADAAPHGRSRPHSRKYDHRTEDSRPWWGGWGHFQPGIIVGSFGRVGERLDDGDALDDQVRFGPVAATIGGGGRALLAGRVLIGGKGFGLLPQSQITPRGRALLAGGGGGLDIGLVMFSNHRWIVYPFAGFGGMGWGLTIDNQSDVDVTVSPAITLAPEEQTDLAAGFATLELGIGFARTAFWGDGGLLHDGEIGVLFGITEDRWKDDNNVSVALPPAHLAGVYFRLGIGGGGFLFKRDPM